VTRERALSAFILAVNAGYALFLPSISGRFASAAGCFVALILLVATAPGNSLAGVLGVDSGVAPLRRLALPIIMFLAPAFSILRPVPHVAFWSVDARALVILAWLAVVSWLVWIARRNGHVRALRALTSLFILWSAAFWLMLVWDVGAGQVVLGNLREDRLLLSFQLWETRPASEHLFLVWLTRDDFARHTVYINHLHPYLFFMYAASKAVQLATGLPLAVGRNATGFAVAAVGVVAFAALVRCVPLSKERGLTFYASLFLLLGFFISEAHYWADMYTTNIDNLYPLWVYLSAILWAAAQPRISARTSTAVIAAAAVFAAFGSIYVPVVIAALWYCTVWTKTRVLVRASAAAAVIGGGVLALPRALAAWKGYSSAASSFLFRSGLDGDTSYFHDPIQAVFRPYWGAPRAWSDLLFPAFVPLLVSAALIFRDRRPRRVRALSQLMFFFCLYAFSLAVFAQSVSIHPYLYDQLLFLPAVLIGATWALSQPVQRRLRGPYLFGAALIILLLITSEYVAIAQVLRKVSV
jgi:hypothetical protein